MTTAYDDVDAPDPTLGSLLAALEAAGIRWLVLRGRAQLDSPGHDVDLLVARDDLSRAEDVVFGLGGVALPRRLHPWHRMYLLDRPTGPRLLLDVVTHVIYHRDLRLRTGLEEHLLARRRWDGVAHVPHPADLFWTVLLHCLLDKQAFSPNRRTELRAAVVGLTPGAPGERYYESLSESLSPDAPTADHLVALVRSGDWPALVTVGEELVQHLRAGRGLDRPSPASPTDGRAPPSVASARRWVRSRLVAAYPYLWRRVGLGATPGALRAAQDAELPVGGAGILRRPFLCTVTLSVDEQDLGRLGDALRRDRFLPAGSAWFRLGSTGIEWVVPRTYPSADASARRPVVVSLSGLDGAGKTYQIDALLADLEGRHRVELCWMPFKIWPEDLLNRIPARFRSRLGPRRTASSAQRPISGGNGAVRRKRPARRLVWSCIATLAAVSGGLSLRTRLRSISGGADVLLLDRYQLDAIVKLQFWYPDVSRRWLATVVRFLSPPPDVQIVLDVPPETAYARKPEQWSVAQLSRQAALYAGLAADIPDVVVLDATDDPARIASAVSAEVRGALGGR